MPQSTDLMGVGMPFAEADQLGNQSSALTCAGTSQTAAATILSKNVTLTASGGATSAILPSSALLGSPHFVVTASSTTASIFCPVGHTLNGTVNNNVTIAQYHAAIFFRFSGNQWYSIPNSP